MALSNEQKAELKAIQQANETAGVSWEAGETSMMELSPDERLLRLGVAEDPEGPTHEERREAGRKSLSDYLSKKGFQADTPTSIDWRNYNQNNFISSVKNQGACGSCVAFGVSAAIEGAMRINANIPVNSTNGAMIQDLSEGQLYFCGAGAQGRTCGGSTQGWWIPAALNYCQSTGLVPEDVDPYTDHEQACGLPSSGWQSKITQISGYSSSTVINGMKSYLANSGPMITQFEVFNDFFSYTSGVYKWNGTSPSAGWHCVAVVGYDDTNQAWICKNSWGTGWGESGYFMIAYGQCSIDAEMWGANGFNSIYPFTPAPNTYTLTIDQSGDTTWSPHNPNEYVGWLNGDQLIINCSFNLNPGSLPPATEYMGLTIGATSNQDATSISDLQTLIEAAINQPGELIGTGITTGSATNSSVFYGATSTIIPSITLSPASRGTLTDFICQWSMTYNGNNTVVGDEREVAVVFGFGYQINGIINN